MRKYKNCVDWETSKQGRAARLLRSWVRIPGGHGYLSVVSVVCCQVEVSATSWSLVQRSPTECGASLCVIWKHQELVLHIYIYIISSLRVKNAEMWKRKNAEMWKRKNGNLSHESVLVQSKFPVTLTYKRRRCEKKLHRWHILYWNPTSGFISWSENGQTP